MLRGITDLQKGAVSKLISELKNDKNEITFKAPTGSGKTYMMADFMNRALSEQPNDIFIVSSLSKSGLARQNYEKFMEYNNKGNFPCLRPYLISSEVTSEERLFIPTDYNVYLLPRDLYKKGGRLMQGAMNAFLTELCLIAARNIFLIKDECHIATQNLDDLVMADYFAKVINFSATPKLSRNQYPDVEITNEDAENTKLIKIVEWGNENDTVSDAIENFEEIKENYRNWLDVNPCLIIQISNKDNADDELQNLIMPALNKKSHLKWMLIVDKDKDCDTNDILKAKNMPVARWKDYAKSNTATIDVIIFKMVITEGWDIPRACMLYQVRDTKSKQLDEQVIGRIRRNPRLLDFEELDKKAQALAMTAWVWGVAPEEQKKVHPVELSHPQDDITNNIRIKTTKLKSLLNKDVFNLADFLAKQKKTAVYNNIFELGKKLREADNSVREIIYDYAKDYTKWWQVAEFIDEIEKECMRYLCNYEESMEIGETVSFARTSHYTDNGNYADIDNWVWKRRHGNGDSSENSPFYKNGKYILPLDCDTDNDFSFDSDAERKWANILNKLSMDGNIDKVKRENGEDMADGDDIYMWGKNYVPNSLIRFEYYMNSVHSSYPDFVMKDRFGRIHIFEVKSLNQSSEQSFDPENYKAKIEELRKCYKQASKITDQIFYIPIMIDNAWKITQFYKGNENTITKDMFIRFVKTHDN